MISDSNAAEEATPLVRGTEDDTLTADDAPPTTTMAPRRRRSSSIMLTELPWHSIQDEIVALLDLMIPTAIIQLGFNVCAFLTASYVGRNYGSVYLDGFTLAYLTGNLTTLTLLQGLFSASDTLSPQAFGAGNHVEVGLLAIRGFVGCMSIAIPINVVLAIFLKDILIWVGQDEEASQHAMDWYRIYLCYLLPYVLYGMTWKFLSSQAIMRPLVVVCLLSVIVILPLSLEFLTRWFGFLGSAMAVVAFQTSQAVLLLVYIWWFQPHEPTTWPSNLIRRHWKDAVAWEPYKRYMILGVGGILMSAEWVYWESLSLMIGTLGVIPLSVHTVPTQVMTVSFMIPLGVGIALAIRLGHTLPTRQGGVRKAKILSLSVLGGGTIVFGGASLAMYHWRHWIYSIFHNQELEPEVWAGCDKIWPLVCWFYFNLSIFGINLGIATGLGMQWTLGLISVVFMWFIGFPAAWYSAAQTARTTMDPTNIDALVAAWRCVPPAYVAINVVLFGCFLKADWYEIRDQIRQREGMVDDNDNEPNPNEATNLLADGYGSTTQ